MNKSHNTNGKRGAQIGNRNALRHGLKAGKMPTEMHYLEPRILRLRRSLEDQIVDIRGEVTVSPTLNFDGENNLHREQMKNAFVGSVSSETYDTEPLKTLVLNFK